MSNKPKLNAIHILAAVALAVVLVTSQSATVFGSGQNGTTLSVEKTAVGYNERTYDWTLEKSVDPTSIELGIGDNETVEYTLTATKSIASEATGVRGQICVTNGGDTDTEGLSIVDNLQYKLPGPGQFQTLTSVPVDLGDNSVIPAGETICYPYDVTFEPIENATYRNEAAVTITNHSGSLGEERTTVHRVSFDLPTTTTEIDATATLDETEPVVDGFSHVDDGAPSGLVLTESDTVTFKKTITNVDATCEADFDFINTALLTENDSGQEREASATLKITTLECYVPPEEEPATAPHTMGYWKTKPHETHTTSLLSVTIGGYDVDKYEKAVAIFDAANAKNAYNMLAGQLLATKLSIADGSLTCTVIDDAVLAADLYLAGYNGADSLPAPPKALKSTITNLIGILDDYNNNGCV